MIPLLVDLHKKAVTVIGGGKIATRKVLRLASETRPKVIAPEITETLQNLALNGKIELILRPYQTGDIEDAQIIYIATSDEAVNQTVRRDARSDQFVNDTSQHERSNFYSMAEVETEILSESDLVLIAISTFGKNPTLSKKIQQLLTKECLKQHAQD
ncbi:precorrin-2 dehydrogenase/sirohydrochlorin ferrochelatase family protein [Lactococcus insecticola]|uniref:precorrin-2 dehydrogenase n=1 Tax=Pseudolactococcus insecticola TaxID=2709158 RepID=A0A6A0B449_9LACT|nr:bifunctional precorrin-2 dehydrogenase/sirohydrochlorin ferrochelatase [Lactococcus insecticola]GFH39932.1 siroheme synthase [Lactococcus insecticola]